MGSLYFENRTPLPWRAEGLYDREPSPEGKAAEAPPEPDEARLYRYYPCTGCGCKVCPHQSAARTASPDGSLKSAPCGALPCSYLFTLL